MNTKKDLIERIEYYNEDTCIFWDLLIQDFFKSYPVQDTSDFDVTNTFTALIGIDYIKRIFDQDIKYPDDDPIHFLEINISGEKSLMYAVYLRYSNPNTNKAPDVSEHPFSDKHRNIPAKVMKFADKHNLTILTYDDLERTTGTEGKVYRHILSTSMIH